VSYARGLKLQAEAVKAVQAGTGPETLFLLEHDPVFTLGRNARRENVLLPEAALRARGFEVCETGRGGDVTYHGPGQLVGYPILALDALPGGRDLHRYLRDLEQGIIDTLAVFGVTAGRRPPYTGVWVGDRKVAAFHGFALNVDPDLSHFDLIHPCGIRHLGVTSLASLLGAAPDRDAVIRALTRSLSTVWRRPLVAATDAEPAETGEETAHV
jgi:lipoate-protein ligase B